MVATHVRWFVAAALVSCTGQIDPGPALESEAPEGAGPTGAGVIPAGSTCNRAAPTAARPAVRRLTRAEYDNTVSDLLGPSLTPARNFVQDEVLHGFDNNADSPIGATVARQYGAAADSLAAVANLTAILPCAPSGGEDACASQFIRVFGKKAYRRPLSDLEMKRLLALYTAARLRKSDFAAGIRIVLSAMLQSPHFVTHIERGGPMRGSNALVPLSAHEIASRLSYFLWSSMPDEALFAAADSGELATPAGIEAQATRMLGLPRARAGVLAFFQQWLDLRHLDDGSGNGPGKDAKRYPLWSLTVRGQMRQETEAFINDVLWSGDGKLTTMLTAPYSFINDKLASIYSMPGITGAALVKRDLDPGRRRGLLTQPSFLALRSYAVLTSPVHRGLFVRERLLCQAMPSPPANDPDGNPVDTTPPAADPSKTTREIYAQMTDHPFCGGCHVLLNPPGLAFEGYDAIGRSRSTENGKPIDSSGQMTGTRDLDGHFTGILDLTDKLARSQEVRDCMAGTMLMYATGSEASELGCEVAKLGAAFTAADTDIRKLIVALTRSDAFRFRQRISAEVCQ